jgi:HAD superfamily hydrolase (TIGR01509 family)
MVRAICFDFDGTLVDSEHLHYAAWQAELQPFGCSLEKSRYMAQFSGVSTYATAKTLIQDYQLPIATEQLMAQKTARFLSLLETELPTPMPGAHELLRDMQQSELAVALVTGSYRKEIEPVLDSLGWRNFFPLIITRDDVQNAKPHPEPYLKAIELFNAKKEEAIVVEDSQRGLTSAFKAGIECAIVKNEFTITQDFSNASYFIESLKELKTILN